MGKNKIILLVEDNPTDEMLVVRVLKKNLIGNEIVVCRDGAEALDYMFGTGKFEGRDTSDSPAVILLDLQLPKINGFEVLKRIRENKKTRNQPVVILTSSDEDKDVLNGYDLGANSYVRKPVDFTEFEDAVKKLGVFWVLHNKLPPKESNTK